MIGGDTVETVGVSNALALPPAVLQPSLFNPQNVNLICLNADGESSEGTLLALYLVTRNVMWVRVSGLI